MPETCSICGNNIINGRCVRFEQHPKAKIKRVKFIGHVVREDPHGDKEDTRPIHKRKKKPNIRVNWDYVEKVIGDDRRK